MNTRYDQMIDGEWHPIKKKNQRTMCCACCLVHREEYRIVNRGTRLEIECRVWRDNKATWAARKRAGILITKVNKRH